SGVLCRITLPQTLPFLAAAAIFTIVSTTSDMTVTNIMLMNPGERTYTEQFYMTFSLSADVKKATLGVLPAVAILTTLIGATLWMVSRITSRRVLVPARQSVIFSAGQGRPRLTGILWITVAA